MYKHSAAVAMFIMLFALPTSNLFAQKVDPKEYQAEIDLGEFLYRHELSAIKVIQYMDSMPYSKHKDTYITYFEKGVYTHVFWEERENEDEKLELWINFVVRTFYPFAFRNTAILEQDFIPNDKDYRFIKAQKRFQTAKLLVDPFKPYYSTGDKLIPVFIEEEGRIVAYVRRIPKFGLPRLGDGFKVVYSGSQQIVDVQPISNSTYSVANVTSQGDLIIQMSKKDCRKNTISPLMVRDILVYKQVFNWNRVVMYCNKNLIIYNARTDSWLIEPEQKYGEWIKRNIGQ